MTIRVNLLKTSEFRRQGVVSGIFVVRTISGTLAAVAVLVGLFSLLNYRTAQRELASSREIWRMRKPVYEKIQGMKADLATQRKLDEEMRGWEAGRIDWYEVLTSVRKVVPQSMQLRRFNVRAETEVKVPKAPAAVVAAAPDGGSAPPPPTKVTGMPVRQFFINIDGRAAGHKSEDVVVQFVRTLGGAEEFRYLFETIKLQSLQRDTAQGGDQASDRMFSIEAATVKKEFKGER